MKPEEKQHVIDRYAERLRRLGPEVEALGWRDRAQQELRFAVLAAGSGIRSGQSVLDIGCGFGDLYDYLTSQGIEVDYTGCDISPDVLSVARERHGALKFEQRDVLTEPYADGTFDHVFASGIFNFRLTDNESFLHAMLRAAFRMSAGSVCANMMTDQVDFRDEQLHYYSPESVLAFCRTLSRSVVLRHDYPLYEFSVFIYRGGEPTSRGRPAGGAE